METAIIVIVIVLVIVAYVAIKRHENKKVNQALDKVSNFTASEIYMSPSMTTSLAIDQEKSKICFIDTHRQTFPFDYKDILECEILTDGETYLKQSTIRTIAGAAIGAAVAGGVGAVVGGLSGKKKKVVDIKNIDLKITLNSGETPYFKVNFFNPQLKKGGTISDKDAMAKAEHWHTLISGLVKKADREGPTQTEKPASVSDELTKLNDLKEKGLLTEDEFQQQKQKLLSQ